MKRREAGNGEKLAFKIKVLNLSDVSTRPRLTYQTDVIESLLLWLPPHSVDLKFMMFPSCRHVFSKDTSEPSYGFYWRGIC
ncbi:hypothetical protein EYF80_036150 [Liparis tanakae]|uniref:Uncharacterized protein n=1 Tax=Liparis tanakae TaxID=230148 RepID=A0A4Z2GLW3_9TELE|nr:hypothetical protein EYF80_036150 [Liparis tanakae]